MNIKPIIYGLTTKCVTNLLVHWTVLQQRTARIQKKSNNIEKPPLTSWPQWFFWRDCHVWRHAHECACICFRPAFSFPRGIFLLLCNQPNCAGAFTCRLVIGPKLVDHWATNPTLAKVNDPPFILKNYFPAFLLHCIAMDEEDFSKFAIMTESQRLNFQSQFYHLRFSDCSFKC